jgi:hypothetical protein
VGNPGRKKCRKASGRRKQVNAAHDKEYNEAESAPKVIRYVDTPHFCLLKSCASQEENEKKKKGRPEWVAPIIMSDSRGPGEPVHLLLGFLSLRSFRHLFLLEQSEMKRKERDR